MAYRQCEVTPGVVNVQGSSHLTRTVISVEESPAIQRGAVIHDAEGQPWTIVRVYRASLVRPRSARVWRSD